VTDTYRYPACRVNGKQVSSVGRAFEPALEHVAPYLPDSYRPFICPMGSGTFLTWVTNFKFWT